MEVIMIKNNSANPKIIKMMGTAFLLLSLTVPLIEAGETAGERGGGKKSVERGQRHHHGHHGRGRHGHRGWGKWHRGERESRAWSKLTKDEKELFGWTKVLQPNEITAVLAYLNAQYPNSVENVKTIAQKNSLPRQSCRRDNPAACKARLSQIKEKSSSNVYEEEEEGEEKE